MRLQPALATAGLLLTLTACSTTAKPDQPAAPPTTAKAYTYQDCVTLLDYDLGQGEPRDASKDPECAHLAPTEYQRAVGEVLTNHADEIINPTNTP